MYCKTYYAAGPDSVNGVSNERLRENYLFGELFSADEIQLNYTHYERIVIGGAAPVNKAVSLPVQNEPASAKDKPLLKFGNFVPAKNAKQTKEKRTVRFSFVCFAFFVRFVGDGFFNL